MQESHLDPPPPLGQVPLSRLSRGPGLSHPRQPASATLPLLEAELRLRPRASENFLVGSLRGREKLARRLAGGEGLPGRLQRFLHPCSQIVSRVGPGPRRVYIKSKGSN